MSPFVKNLLIRAAITGAIVGFGGAAAILSTGTFGELGQWVTLAATTLGAIASAFVSILTTAFGDPASGTFTD